MLIVGIVGGIASGKSAVSATFEEFGAFVLDADRIGHQVLDLEIVRDQIRDIWGNSVFRLDGKVDRTQLGKVVFDPVGGETELSKLENISHPLIGQILANQIQELKRSGEFPIVVLDAPVMFKAGWNQFCDFIIFVDSCKENRLRRSIQRGWSQAEFTRRETSQVSIELKQAKANWIIRNEGSLANLKQQASLVWDQLLQTPTRSNEKD
ncbi:MAG: dephospho-CoA kinase [Planctomycetota bacterium]|nr:dephospho-CoA kinase [Planctomycetota bacterium]